MPTVAASPVSAQVERPQYIPESLTDEGRPIPWRDGPVGETPSVPGDVAGSQHGGETRADDRAVVEEKAEPVGRSPGDPRAGAEDTSGGGKSGRWTIEGAGPEVKLGWEQTPSSSGRRDRTTTGLEGALASIGMSRESVGKSIFTEWAGNEPVGKMDLSTRSVKIEFLKGEVEKSGGVGASRGRLLDQVGRLLSGRGKAGDGSIDVAAVRGETGFVAREYEVRNGPLTVGASLGDVGASGNLAAGFDGKGRPRLAMGGSAHATAISTTAEYVHPMTIADIDMQAKLILAAKALDVEATGKVDGAMDHVEFTGSGSANLLEVRARPTMTLLGYEVGMELTLGLGSAFEARGGFGHGKKNRIDGKVDFGVRKGVDFILRSADEDEDDRKRRRTEEGPPP